ncbi:hypothetical protein JXB02_04290 [Candidatus Woesearchaeota archaeon]|nr:hypothetical protein [Candidatus Woesearchaeota archaeon]
MAFIKDIFTGTLTDQTHAKLVRYSLGTFEKEPFVVKKGKDGIRVEAGFEYLDTLLALIARIVEGPVSLRGVIVTKDDISSELDRLGIEPAKATGKKRTIKQDVDAATFTALVGALASRAILLLGVKAEGISLSVGKSVPKPGKTAERFCALRLPAAALGAVREEFLFDVPGDFSRVTVRNTYEVKEVIVDERLLAKDPAAARLAAKRRVRVIRDLDVDGTASRSETEQVV